MFGLSKRKLLALWLEKFPELTFVFSELSCMPESVTDSSVDAIEQYWVAAYDSQKKFGICGLNDLRFLIFNSSAINDLRRLPPTRDSLRQHVKRAAFIAGWYWGGCLQKGCVVTSPFSWGWEKIGSRMDPTWTTVPAKSYSTLFTVCACKKKCLNCKCRKQKLRCLPFCKCMQKCHNPEG